MNFEWTSEQIEQRKKLAGLLGGDIRSGIDQLETAEPAAMKDILSRCLQALGESGYLALAQGSQRAEQTLDLIALHEELAPASTSLFIAVETGARLAGGLIADAGSAALRETWLPSINAGRAIAALALAEPPEEKGGHPQQTAARREGDGLILSGLKPAVTNAPLADVFVTAATLDEKQAWLVVPAEADGVKIGARRRTLGMQGLAVASVEFAEVKVPAGNVLGPAADGAFAFMRMMEELMFASAGVGLAAALLAEATAHAKAHRRGGKPIIAHQEIGFQLAEIFAVLETARWYVRRAAWMMTRRDREAPTLAHCAKVFCSENAEIVAGKALQIAAGQGYAWGNAFERGYRDAKYLSIGGVSNELARLAIAEEALRKYAID